MIHYSVMHIVIYCNIPHSPLKMSTQSWWTKCCVQSGQIESNNLIWNFHLICIVLANYWTHWCSCYEIKMKNEFKCSLHFNWSHWNWKHEVKVHNCFVLLKVRAGFWQEPHDMINTDFTKRNIAIYCRIDF